MNKSWHWSVQTCVQWKDVSLPSQLKKNNIWCIFDCSCVECLCRFSEWLSEADLEISLVNNGAIFLANSQSDVACVFGLLWRCQDTANALCLAPKRSLTFPLSFSPFLKDIPVLQGQVVQFVRQNRNLGTTHLRSSAHSGVGLVSDIAASQWPVPRVGVKTPGYWFWQVLTHFEAKRMSFSTNSPSSLMGQGNVALCIPLLTQQSQLVPRAAPVLLWVSQHYNIMSFCGEKRGKGPEFSHILPAAKLFPVPASINS